MIRLLMACAVAYSLLPANMAIQGATQNATSQQSGLTRHDTLSAVQSTFSDVMGFCDRNVEACLTAQTLASEAKQKAIQTLNNLSKTENHVPQGNNSVQIEQGSISVDGQ